QVACLGGASPQNILNTLRPVHQVGVPFAHRSKLLFDACSQQVFSVSPTQSGLKLLTEVGGLSRRRESAIQAEQMRSFGILGLARSEEHTSELQSRENLVCRLLLEKK